MIYGEPRCESFCEALSSALTDRPAPPIPRMASINEGPDPKMLLGKRDRGQRERDWERRQRPERTYIGSRSTVVVSEVRYHGPGWSRAD
jgi:hypothetical protein